MTAGQKQQIEAQVTNDSAEVQEMEYEELLAFKTTMESKKDTLDLVKVTPTTYEILKDSKTYDRLINIISSNPNEFKKLP
jgi:hypothetical protein